MVTSSRQLSRGDSLCLDTVEGHHDQPAKHWLSTDNILHFIACQNFVEAFSRKMPISSSSNSYATTTVRLGHFL
jgi:hypothetical protein